MARTVKCPNCGAELAVQDDMRSHMFCDNCGTEVTLSETSEQDDKEIELARIKAQKEVELEKLKIEREVMKQEKEERERKKRLMFCVIAYIVLMGLLFLMSFLSKQ